ncbi:MAG: retroviral-like aspartic protease [Planctomycetales bacterium]|nr:retroviral-like aspartic protease [Planctomycetales bacterium]
MKYPYQHVRCGDSIRYLPLVPVTLSSSGTSIRTLALVDSGAEDNVFRMDVAEQLGLNLTGASEVVILGYDGQDAEAYRVMVSFELGNHQWDAPVIFSPAVAGRDLLGQIGFFAFFTVTFDYTGRTMNILRPRV